jgi:hypothetical protein
MLLAASAQLPQEVTWAVIRVRLNVLVMNLQQNVR